MESISGREESIWLHEIEKLFALVKLNQPMNTNTGKQSQQ
jgi:hypothetical protein